MNSSLNNRKNRRYYTKETFFDKAVGFLRLAFAALISLIGNIYNFVSRPEVALVLKGLCVAAVLCVIVGAVGEIESRKILFGDALIRIFGALAAACVVFKAIGD